MPSILLSGPGSEPVSLAEAKAFLRVEHDAEDGLIGTLLTGARVHVETHTRRALIAQSWRLVRDAWPSKGRIRVLPAPLRSLSSVRVRDLDGVASELDPGDFALDTAGAPGQIAPPRGAMSPGRPFAGIELDVEVGYGDAPADVPEPLRQAIRMLVAHWYENRSAIRSGPNAPQPLAVAALIAPYTVLWP